ncbi:NitT/TauT family transport system permease protein [Bryocella elongata]|uniref:NitT/TauT family transport system permease protein n=1 Tax=Bryocella elongata TaxID=863522 RepID=A0A1H6B0Q5_9BACT|nr:ABC transporter permease [Bryocella elongata]SEG54180.1 NitT/TauT family transport system permease protein [Bryocella elongata]
MKKRLVFVLNSLGVFLAMLLVWRGIIAAFNVPAYMLPTPWMVTVAFGEHLNGILSALLITTEEAVLGIVSAVILGVLIALIFARSEWIRRLLFPYTVLLQTVPIMAVTPLIIMWVGPGQAAVTLVAFIFCVSSIIANTTQGLISVNDDLVALFLMHNASPAQVLAKLRLPHSLPYLFVGIRISSGLAVIGAITGELFAGSSRVGQGGLGYSILYAMAQMQTDLLFALVIASTILGFAFFFTATFLEWLMLHKWHESAAVSRLES